MGLFDGFGGMGAGMMGLGLLGDAFGAYSNYQAQQRQRDLYKKQLEIQNILRNPNAVLAGSQPYYQANLSALNTAMPNIIRQQVAPQLGMQGIDPTGGQGQLITQQAIAPYVLQAQQNAQNQYINTLTGGQQGLNYAGQAVGQPAGQMGNTGAAMRTLMMMQALRENRAQPNPQPGLSPMPQGYGGMPDMEFDPNMAGQMGITNPLTYQFPVSQFG